ncbi:hypothetical protein N752_09325 [Desulforamulus aquiferis]|nr:hypothetical protein [Desulforamulus aquiferis]RYD05537.1 hypothetical protein N752_09325 [Desulforamulus aquiferis]
MFDSGTTPRRKGFSSILFLLIFINIILLIGAQLKLTSGQFLSQLNQGPLGNLHVIFFSILIEALPFIVIGVIGSTLLEVFVSPDTIRSFCQEPGF